MSLYDYVGGDPVNKIDPTGKFINFVVGGIIGEIVGGTIEAAKQLVTTGKIDAGAVAEAAATSAFTGALGGGAIKLGSNLTKLIKEINKAKKITDRVKKKTSRNQRRTIRKAANNAADALDDIGIGLSARSIVESYDNIKIRFVRINND